MTRIRKEFGDAIEEIEIEYRLIAHGNCEVMANGRQNFITK